MESNKECEKEREKELVQQKLNEDKYKQAQFLQDCVFKGKLSLLICALEAGMDPNHPPHADGPFTPILINAISFVDINYAEILIKFGACVYKKERFFESRILDYASSIQKMMLLLRHGAKYNYSGPYNPGDSILDTHTGNYVAGRRSWCRRVDILLIMSYQKPRLTSDLVRLLDTFGI